MFDDVYDELILYIQAILEWICTDPIICIETVVERFVGKEFEKGSKTTLKFDFKADIPRTISNALKQVKARKERCK